MRYVAAMLILVLALTVPVLGDTPFAQLSVSEDGKPVVRAPSMTVSTTPIGFTAAQIVSNSGAQVQKCVGRVETDSVRIGVLGILTPSASAGMIVYAGEIITVTGHDNVRRFLAVRVTNDATIKWMCTADSL